MPKLFSLKESGVRMERQRLKGYLLVLGAACLWGTLGIAGRMLYAAGLSPGAVAAWRAAIAGLTVAAGLAVVRPAALRIALRDIPYFVAYGLISVAAFYLFYLRTIQLISVAAAAVLLYTAPAFVAVAGRLLYGEPLTGMKLLALGVTLAGCALVAGAFEPGAFQARGAGLLTGLGAGFTYGMYSIFGKHGVRKYDPWTVQAYSMLFGALALAAFYGPEAVRALGRAPQVWPVVAYMGLVPTVAAYGLYLSGLRWVESSHAAIFATAEPVVAALLGLVVLGEPLGWVQVAGIGLVLSGIGILHRAAR